MARAKSINPFSEEVEFEHDLLTPKQVEQKILLSKRSQVEWSQTSLEKRCEHLIKLSQILRRDQKAIAEIITKEMGKTLKSAFDEVEKCAVSVEFLGKQMLNWNQTQHISMPSGKHRVSFQPLGVTLGIMPWNFPIWQAVRFLAPSLAMGNSVLLKPASNVFQSSKILELSLLEAGFPEGVYQHLSLGASGVEQVVSSSEVQGVSLTGSTSAGKKVAEVAGRHMKKMVFELGGSDPYLIFEDADLELAAQKCAESRLINSGQSCICAKRFIVHKNISQEFLDLFMNEMASKNYGDPMNEVTDFGPLARKDLRQELQALVERAEDDGAHLILGGKIPEGSGYLYPATILVELPKQSELFNEEFFGPVALVNEFESLEEAFQMANQTPYGLGSGIFSKDAEQAEKLAEQHLQAGMCAINDYIKSDVRLPFGGVKESGFGRELGPYGVHEFANIKTLSVY